MPDSPTDIATFPPLGAPVRLDDGRGATVVRIDADLTRRCRLETGEVVCVSPHTLRLQRGERTVLDGAIALRVVAGSRAQGLASDDSDTDRRGVWMSPSSWWAHLAEPPEQLEDDPGQLVLWEIRKFLRLVAAGNPTTVETLFSPIVETANEIGHELLARRESFLARSTVDRFIEYGRAQLREVVARAKNDAADATRWRKQASHAIRIVMQACEIAERRTLSVALSSSDVASLQSVRAGGVSLDDVVAHCTRLIDAADRARSVSSLPERVDESALSDILLRARRATMSA
ncbi:MAG: nucleotidyltransferase domain-containing protein [Phycisphaerae bacterium]|nr:nucleotidyltransferase domain-containing protein [Phycisphaerae bacterium]